MRAPSPALVMSDAQREILERLAKSQTAAHREVTRAKALLLAADGLASTAVAYEVGVSPSSVVAWRSRFAQVTMSRVGAKTTIYQTSPSRWLWPESRRAMRSCAASRMSGRGWCAYSASSPCMS